jgi:uncharacterized repeat protein (TIGR01451 family)
VITTQILALVTSATVGAIQPTPQMAQEAAQTFHLPLWLSDGLTKLAWGAEQLFGAPESAQAALPAPGGIDANLRLWVKAGAGTSSTTDGATITSWNDQSGNSANMAVTAAGREPVYKAGTAATNYNPTVLFDGINDGMELAPFMTGVEAGGSVFSVASNDTPGTGFDNLVVFGIDNPHLGTAASTGKPLGYMNGSSPIRADHPDDPVPGRFHIWGWEWTMAAEPSNTSSNTGLDVIFDGKVFTEPTMELRASQFANGAPAADQFQIGSYEAVEVWDGNISEVIVYDRNLTAAESQRVNSYLALKYGVTLNPIDDEAGIEDGDYVASDGTTVAWDHSANSAYHNNVGGIGRDDNSALDQRKSNSVNSGFQPVIDNGAAFSADKSFLVWGSDTGAASFGTAYAPTSYTPTTGYYRMNRIWKVQETGTVGTVQVQGPANANLLLVDNDGNYANGGVTEVPLTNGAGSFNFASGQFFTFGAEATAPGGVAGNMAAWWKANMGAETAGSASTNNSSVDAWRDQGLNDNDAFQSNGTLKPEWLENNGKFNFNPSLTFVPNARMQAALNASTWGNNDGTAYIIYNQQTAFTGWRNLVDFGLTAGDSNNPQLGMSDNNRIATWMDGFDRDNTNWIPVINETRLGGYDWQFNVGGHSYYRDGEPFTGSATHKIGSSTIDIGTFANIGGDPQLGEYFPGQIAEIVLYSEQHDASERARVQSYFALKYGVTLDTAPTNATTNFDYVDSGGATIWAGNGANSGYHNDVAGIGRDDASALNQKQSKSVNSDDVVTISLGTLASTNAANSNTFAANKSFLIWGNNNGSTSFGSAYTPDSFTPTTPYYRMGRIWKVQETGTITTVQVSLSAGAEYMIVDTDGDGNFATGTQDEIPLSGGSFAYNFDSGDYFTFMTPLIAPGGVAANLAHWAKADADTYSDFAGLTSANPGDLVGRWNDQSGNGIDLQASADGGASTSLIKRPELAVATTRFNYNPALYFNGSKGMVYNNKVLDNTDSGTMFAVANWQTKAGYQTIYGFGPVANDSALGLLSNTTFLFYDDFSAPAQSNYPTAVAVDTSYILGADWTIDATDDLQISLNGNRQLTNGEVRSTNPERDDKLCVGADCFSGETFAGYMPEVITYDRRLTLTELARVNTYLAIKYGVTMTAMDYIAADGTTTVWSQTANAGFNNDIAGIARDDAEGLHQKQSKSVNSDDIVIMGLGMIAADNASNPNTFATNNSYLIWGNNNGAVSLTANYNGGSNNRIARVWRVRETGTVGAVKLVIPRSAAPSFGLRSLIVHASDPNFGSVDRTYPLVSRGGNYEVMVDFNNGDYFTFSSSSTLPEIHVTPGFIDFGTVNTGTTSPVGAVTIQNQGDVSLNLSSISLSGVDAGHFAISSNSCGGSVSAGGSCTVNLTFTPTTAGAKSAQLVINSNDSDEPTVNVTLSGTTPSITTPETLNQYNLAVTKSASVANATPGTPFNYTVTVLNKGTIAAANAVMTDQLPTGVTFNSANATGGGTCSHNSGIVTCTWPTLAGGATATVTISVTP